MTLTAYRM